MMNSERSERHGRIEGFSDAVFALAATLLVVTLEVPDSFASLVAELSSFGAFALSFTALILIWSVHRAFFRRYALHDRTTVVLNSCLLFVVLFYVYPLKFVSEGVAATVLGIGEVSSGIETIQDLAALFLLYSAGFVLVFCCVAGLYFHASRSSAALDLSHEQRQEARFYMRHYALFVAVGLLSIALATAQVGVAVGLPGWIYVLIGPACYLHGAVSHRNAVAAPAG